MRRRRLPRRPVGKEFQDIPRVRYVSPRIRAAHQLFKNGDYTEAAKLFQDIAEKAEARGILQAPYLYLRSGAAYLETGNRIKTEEMIKKSWGLLMLQNRWRRLEISIATTTKNLQQAGQGDLAEKLNKWVDEQIPQDIRLEAIKLLNLNNSADPHPKLPSKCPDCGGPVQPDEIEWYDADNPVCSYCGSVLRND